ncbi:MAG TPA: hypothetical protein VN690_12055 [Terriglobales bacterium]|nr:hypothetical protein [Terriglobales bacterium]
MDAAAAVGGGVNRGRWAAGRGRWGRWWAAAACLLMMGSAARGATYFVTVAGLGGEPDYVQRYTADAATLDKIFKQAGPDAHVLTLSGADATRAKLSAALAEVAGAAKPDDDFVLVLIGHGSYDGVEYKFNLIGPDISASELAAQCNRIAARRQLIVDATEASGGALSALQSPTRAVIAATKSGTEKNATVFARYFVEALQDPAADLDKNEAISAMEAFEYAQRKVADFYTSQQRLATEHATNAQPRLLASLTLVRFGAAQQAYSNPALRALLTKKEELERQIDALNYKKDALSDEDYKTQITGLLLQLAQTQKQIDAGGKTP